MERNATLIEAYNVMNNNIIGPNEIKNNCKEFLNVNLFDEEIPEIPYTFETLLKYKDSHLLVLVNPYTNSSSLVTIKFLRDYFGCSADLNEPCFYNQDWYEREYFFTEESLKFEWVLININLDNKNRGNVPKINSQLPTALLCSYVFFITYLCRKTIIWRNDYVWCNNFDNLGDQIYVGRYIDSSGFSNNGFSIHRHLSIKNNYVYFNLV